MFISASFVYLLNIFAKAVISQLITEASVAPTTADPIGIVAITIFANNDLRWQGTSLIDILIAKFHVVCPVLFGVLNGNEKTEAGRKRLGWWKDPDTGGWVSEQRHSERMTGLGAGFAALSLRDFKQSKSSNPFPPRNYWTVLAGIVNLPKDAITQTHCVLLRALIEHHVGKFIGFFGQAAIALLKVAVVDFPRKADKSVGSIALATLSETIRKDYKLTL